MPIEIKTDSKTEPYPVNPKVAEAAKIYYQSVLTGDCKPVKNYFEKLPVATIEFGQFSFPLI